MLWNGLAWEDSFDCDSQRGPRPFLTHSWRYCEVNFCLLVFESKDLYLRLPNQLVLENLEDPPRIGAAAKCWADVMLRLRLSDQHLPKHLGVWGLKNAAPCDADIRYSAVFAQTVLDKLICLEYTSKQPIPEIPIDPYSEQKPPRMGPEPKTENSREHCNTGARRFVFLRWKPRWFWGSAGRATKAERELGDKLRSMQVRHPSLVDRSRNRGYLGINAYKKMEMNLNIDQSNKIFIKWSDSSSSLKLGTEFTGSRWVSSSSWSSSNIWRKL